MLISDLSVDEILDKYFLDTDKVHMWWQANIDPSNKVLFSNSPFKIAKQQKNVVAM